MSPFWLGFAWGAFAALGLSLVGAVAMLAWLDRRAARQDREHDPLDWPAL